MDCQQFPSLAFKALNLLTAVLAWTPLFTCQPERFLFCDRAGVISALNFANQNQRPLITGSKSGSKSNYSVGLIVKALKTIS